LEAWIPMASEQPEVMTYYLAKSSPLHDSCFFTEKPTMLIFRNGSILWTDASFDCKLYGLHLVMPMLDVPVGNVSSMDCIL